MDFDLTPQALWLIVAALLGAVEALTVAFLALPLAFGACLTALFAWLTGASFASQVWFFTITSGVSLAGIQYWFRTSFKNRPQKVKSNTAALIGRMAMVTEEINGMTERGFVKVGGETWSALSLDDKPLTPKTTVYIHAVDGVKLIVSTVRPPDETP